MTGSPNISEFSKKMSSSNQTLLTVVRSSVIHSDLKTYLQVELIRSPRTRKRAQDAKHETRLTRTTLRNYRCRMCLNSLISGEARIFLRLKGEIAGKLALAFIPLKDALVAQLLKHRLALNSRTLSLTLANF